MNKRGVMIRDTRGISNLIAYIILISMSLALSTIAYQWIMNTLPQETITCPEGVSVSIRDVNCSATNQQLSFTVKNNGAFTIDKLRVFVNDEPADIAVYEFDPAFFPSGSNFVQDPLVDSQNPLSPGDLVEYDITYTDFVTTGVVVNGRTVTLRSNLRLLEVRPYKVIEGEEYVCGTVQTRLVCDTS